MRTKPFVILVSLWVVIIIIIGLMTRPAKAQAACTARTDWPAYVVARGDTLYRIARRFNTTTAILSTANCLTNNNRIFVGQVLRVPSSGTVMTLPPTQGSNRPITFQPYEGGYMLWWAESGDIWVLTGAQNGALTSYPSRSYGGLPDNLVRDVTPPNRVRPIMGFGRLWGNFANVRVQMGWATASEQSFISSFIYDPVYRNYTFTVPGGRTLYSDGRTWNTYNGIPPTPPPITPPPSPIPGDLDVRVSYQPFERGFMIWRSDNGNIGVYFGTSGGMIAHFDPSQYANLPDFTSAGPTGSAAGYPFYRPILGFGKVWSNYDWVRNQIGWGIGPEISYTMHIHYIPSQSRLTFTIPYGGLISTTLDRYWNYLSGGPPPGQTVTPQPLPPVPTPTSTTGLVVTTNAAYQVFENGFMIWRADTGDIWVFPKQATMNYFGQFDYQNLPDNPVTETPPTARLSPINGFGRVWGNFSQIRSALGWAMDTEKSYSATLHNIHVASPDGVKSLSGYCFNLPDGRNAQFPQYLDAATIAWGYVESCG